MDRRRIVGIGMAVCLVGLTGCAKKDHQSSDKTNEVMQMSEISENNDGKEKSVEEVAGKGFQMPEGSHIDKNGNIVDREGNTFDHEGRWQVPEGGHVDSKGRIIDKNGKVMGGGAPVGSVG